MKVKKLLLAATLPLIFSGCTLNTTNLSGKGLEHWRTFQSGEYRQPQMDEQLTNIVFIREDIDSTAINVFVNGEYLTSLLNNAYKPVVICASNQQLTMAYNDNRKFNDRFAGKKYNFAPQTTHFIKVFQKGDDLDLELLDDESASILMSRIAQQNHVLPRVERISSCDIKPVKQFNLEAGALFPLNQYSHTKMLPEGKREISKVIETISKEKIKIKKIKVIGYTDPEGSDQLNKPLSYNRANTVKQMLEQGGIVAPIEAVGLASENLVVGNCRALHPKNSKARAICNQPNRRVEIVIYSDKNND
ncbi:OmpA family protein [Pasteurella testudinis]|uniref:OmpA family protein n=1 Tax=Pasteurella testudinis TaxID=761 RepID=UPI00405873C6